MSDPYISLNRKTTSSKIKNIDTELRDYFVVQETIVEGLDLDSLNSRIPEDLVNDITTDDDSD